MFFRKKEINPNTGVLLDNRKASIKSLDVSFKEIVASASPVTWEEKKELRKFPEYNQGSTSACVAFSAAKLLGIYYQQRYNYFVNFSPAFIYNERINKPNEGMYAYDAWNILKEKGSVFSEMMPPATKEKEINSLVVYPHFYDVAKVFRISSEVVIPLYNGSLIDTIASIIDTTQKGVMVWIYANVDEWSLQKPTVLYPDLSLENAPIKHSIVAVDFTLLNGEKTLVIEDSAPFGGFYRRFLSENFLTKRCFYAAYFMNFKFENQNEKPKFEFKKDLFFGMKNDFDVKMLQKCLKFEGLFPANVESTGYFGSITLDAVKKFQTKYGIQPVSGYVGPLTRAKLNELYGV